MALTEETVEDKIEVVGDYKAVQVRTATVIKKDGVEINRSFHRHVLHPSTKTGKTYKEDGTVDNAGTWGDTDISGESTEVQAICNAVWTDAVKTAYQTMIDTQEA